MNSLSEWILEHVEDWRQHRDTNYASRWEEYERLWRGEWSSQDKTRESERSRIISPALQQAIENHTAEIEEAVFGQGAKFFDIVDDMQDQQPADIEYVSNYMQECFKKNKIRKSVGDVVLMASLYGTGIGEIVLKEKKEYTPSTQNLDYVDAQAVGVTEGTYISVTLKPIAPTNFLIDPNATSIDDALGVAVEEFVSSHKIAQGVAEGIYKEAPTESSPDMGLEVSKLDQPFDKNKVKLLTYYGLVPSDLLEQELVGDGEWEDLLGNKEEFTEHKDGIEKKYNNLVEAIVVIANEDTVLKAEKSPYMMQDRPIVAYQDDSVPGRFWGRGVAEKGYNMQKAVDAQMRSHLDSLALTTVPMMGIDATRLPRGAKFEVRPGKTVLTNGNPAEILAPFKFGNTDASNIETARVFEQMLLKATGTSDGPEVPTTGMGEAGLTGMSIALSGIIKRNKRTLVNFQENFLLPFVTKAAHRFMQFDPEHFPTQDFKFIPISTLGMLAREVEQVQFLNLMKTLGADSPILPLLMTGVLENSSLSNKQQLIQAMQKMSQPSPEQQQMEQMHHQLQMQAAQAQIAEVMSKAELNKAKVANEMVETQIKPLEAKARLVSAATSNLGNGDGGQAEFDRRVKVADLALKEKDIDNKTAIAQMQLQASKNT